MIVSVVKNGAIAAATFTVPAPQGSQSSPDLVPRRSPCVVLDYVRTRSNSTIAKVRKTKIGIQAVKADMFSSRTLWAMKAVT